MLDELISDNYKDSGDSLDNQKSWLDLRNKCKDDPANIRNCLRDSMMKRLEELCLIQAKSPSRSHKKTCYKDILYRSLGIDNVTLFSDLTKLENDWFSKIDDKGIQLKFYLLFLEVSSNLKKKDDCLRISNKIEASITFGQSANYQKQREACGLSRSKILDDKLKIQFEETKKKFKISYDQVIKVIDVKVPEEKKLLDENELLLKNLCNTNCTIEDQLSALHSTMYKNDGLVENIKLVKNECGNEAKAFFKHVSYGCTKQEAPQMKYTQFGKNEDLIFYLIYKNDFDSLNSKILQKIIFFNEKQKKALQVFDVENDFVYLFEHYQDLRFESLDCNKDKLEDLKFYFQSNSAKGSYGQSYCWFYDSKSKLFKSEHGEVIDEDNE